MQPGQESTSFAVRFLDSFLKEQNIKWLLSVGAMILVGSSLRLVSMHWGEYTPFWKYGILLTYTAAIFAASQVSYYRLGLLRTGTALMALTVLLIPLTFSALHWVRPTGTLTLSDLGRHTGLALLLGINLVGSSLATHRIFVLFLRRPQPTFQFCYITFCVAGAILPGLPTAWAPGLVGLLWLLFAAGTLKVNRHLFWLCEEERRPRIFGFFPILLLGAQFVGLFAIYLAREIPMQWWGLACVLTAIPVLLTSDTVLKVFQQRTGNLVRPIPISIIAPLVVGLLLCATGVCLALTGLPRPYAVVPVALLSAGALMIVAQRTGSQAFTWAGIAALLLGYQFSPLFFLEFARTVVQNGAAAVHEQRLPLAFYGLTYLPILILFTGASVLLERFRKPVFSVPLRHAAVVLAWVLLLAACSHPKALFPVSAVMLLLFSVQMFCFTDRRFLIPANLSLLGMAWGLPVFLSGVLGVSDLAFHPEFIFAVVGLLQLVPGRFIDRLTSQLNRGEENSQISPRICEQFSLATTLMTGASVIVSSLQHPALFPPVWSSLILGSLLTIHAFLNVDSRLGLIAILFTNILGAVILPLLPIATTVLISLVIGVLLAQWTLGMLLTCRPNTCVSRTFSLPLKRFSSPLLSIALLTVVLPSLWHLHQHSHLAPVATSVWLSIGLMLSWTICVAVHERHRPFAAISFVIVLLFTSAACAQSLNGVRNFEWVPLIWSVAGIAQLAAYRLLQRTLHRSENQSNESVLLSAVSAFGVIEALVPSLLAGVLTVTLVCLGLPARLAAGVAIIGLLFRRHPKLDEFLPRELVGSAAIWQAICLQVQLLTGSTGTLFSLTLTEVSIIALPVALTAAVCVMGIEILLSLTRFKTLTQQGKTILQGEQLLLSGLCLLLLLVPFVEPLPVLSPLSVAMIIAASACFVVTFLLKACREQSAATVWAAEVTVALAVAELVALRVIDLQFGIAGFLLMGMSFSLLAISRAVSGSERLRILSGPFELTACWLPLLTVILALGRHGMGVTESWKGMNSLALLLASSFYFFRGMTMSRMRNWGFALVILNLALALLWRELNWTDAQLFLIPIGLSVLFFTEMLRREIPEQYQTILHYVGGLTILVSPTFEIVGGSWGHLLSLMILSVLTILLAIGLRIRSFVYLGNSFLIADLIAMVVRGSLDHPNLLWGVGVMLGLGVISLAAYCEHHREGLMSRIRRLSAELELWR